MIRGTTPTMVFSLPFNTGVISVAHITFMQRGKVVLDKELHECKCNENEVEITLTQEETLLFSSGYFIEAQVRARNNAGEALASDIIKIPAERILKDGVI